VLNQLIHVTGIAPGNMGKLLGDRSNQEVLGEGGARRSF